MRTYEGRPLSASEKSQHIRLTLDPKIVTHYTGYACGALLIRPLGKSAAMIDHHLTQPLREEDYE